MSNANSGNNSNGPWTITIPNNTTTVGGWYTVSVPYTVPAQQISLDFEGIDLAVPVDKKKVSDGCTCKKCDEFFPYAEPNQEDGTLVCYSCRMRW